MLKSLFFFLLLTSNLLFFGQDGWTWSVLPNMPEAVSNNAVSQGYSGETLCVYSFCGIDETKLFSGIHLKTWRYNTVTQTWSQLEDVPDIQGKIAAAASTVNNKIYVIGGYHVNANSTEISSEKIHVFDPETNSWLPDAMDLPTPIDDQVQSVWNDSLIFVVTGWSNNGNVNKVQIFNPSLNQWQEGTNVPAGQYQVFGGAGTITGDSIFYYGGVINGSFTTQKKLRKGIINADDPTEIDWTNLGNSPGNKGYRCGAIHYQDRIFFVGGAGDGYNYDGISYATSQGVAPLHRILTWWSEQEIWSEGLGAPYGVMDLRGLAKVNDNQWIICGGMTENQEVSDAVYLLTLDTDYGVSVREEIPLPYRIYFKGENLIIQEQKTMLGGSIQVLDITGKILVNQKLSSSYNSIQLPAISKGVLVVTILDNQGNFIQSSRVIQP